MTKQRGLFFLLPSLRLNGVQQELCSTPTAEARFQIFLFMFALSRRDCTPSCTGFVSATSE
jgi:hypothetical protein